MLGGERRRWFEFDTADHGARQQRIGQSVVAAIRAARPFGTDAIPGQDVIRRDILGTGNNSGGHPIGLIDLAARHLLGRAEIRQWCRGLQPIADLEKGIITADDNLDARVARILEDCWPPDSSGEQNPDSGGSRAGVWVAPRQVSILVFEIQGCRIERRQASV